MPELKHWKIYEPIEDINAFDAASVGPSVTTLQVTANTHASELYPDTRVGVVIGGLGSFALTLAQSATVRGQLERAERDVRAGLPARLATGAEGRCESCSQRIRAGERVIVEDDAVLHAEPCPEEDRAD